MFVKFGCVPVQILDRVLVDVFRLLAGSMNVRVRVLVGVGVRVGMRMHDPTGVRMLVCVDVRMNVGVRMVVFDLIRHGVFFLGTGEKGGLAGCGHAAIASHQSSYSTRHGNKEQTGE